MIEPSFVAAWSEAQSIDGWLSKREADVLWRAAIETPPGGLIVEVGAYHGRSTALLAHSGRHVITIDPLAIGFGEGNGMHVVASDEAALDRVVSRHHNVRWMRCRANQVATLPIDLLYIDGDHTGHGPLCDALHFLPAMKAGSRLAFHDYGTERPVLAAVCYLEVAGRLTRLDLVGSMYLGEVLA